MKRTIDAASAGARASTGTLLGLVVYSELPPRRVSLEDVVRHEASLLLVLRHASTCEVDDYEWQYEAVAVLIAKGPERVLTFFAPAPARTC